MLRLLKHETTHSWNSEPQNIECRTAEFRRVESLRAVFFKIDRSTTEAHDGPFDTKAHDRQNSLLRHSSFVIPCRPDQVIGNNGALGFG